MVLMMPCMPEMEYPQMELLVVRDFAMLEYPADLDTLVEVKKGQKVKKGHGG